MLVKLRVKTSKIEEFVNITELVSGAVEKSGVKDGIAIVFCPHTTAAI
ncbi:MAG: YjbQ family protein [Endomicrobium sp.]|jgi:thiamine phosphate synthase YjbQ (UPF0047 family)|nr:YjbQ family protein [Endomicrobium sp.]